MTNLEEELGVSLLERSVHGTKPTAMGEMLYRHARTILRQFDDARSAIRSGVEAPSGRVAVGLPTSTSRILAAPLLGRLLERYPFIELELVEASSGDLTGQVAMDRLAMAVTMDARADARLRVEPILEEELFAVVDAKQKKPKVLTLQALAALPLLLSVHPNSVRVALDRLLQPKGLRYRVVAETSVVEILLNCVERGLGATILPTSAFARAQQLGQVQGIPISGRPLTRELSLSVSVAAASSPAVQCVRETLLRVAQEEVAKGRWKGVRLLSAAEPVQTAQSREARQGKPARSTAPKRKSAAGRARPASPRRPEG